MPKKDAASLTQHPAEGNCIAALVSENRYARLCEQRREIAGKSCYGYRKRIGERESFEGRSGSMRPRANSILAAIRIVTIGAIASTFLLARTGAQIQGPPPGPYCALGLEILSPTEGFDFTPYIRPLGLVVLQNGTKQMPEDAKMGEKGAVAVVMTIQKDGTLTGQGPTTDVGSRYKDMDRAALEAVRASAPFERLPDGFKGTELKLRVTFFYTVSPPLPKH